MSESIRACPSLSKLVWACQTAVDRNPVDSIHYEAKMIFQSLIRLPLCTWGVLRCAEVCSRLRIVAGVRRELFSATWAIACLGRFECNSDAKFFFEFLSLFCKQSGQDQVQTSSHLKRQPENPTNPKCLPYTSMYTSANVPLPRRSFDCKHADEIGATD